MSLQEPMSRSMQLHYIPVTTFSQTDLFLDPICQEWHRLGSAITYHKKLIDVAASLDRNCLSFTKKVSYSYNSVKMPWHRLTIGVVCSWLVRLCIHNLRLKNCLDRKKRKLCVCLLNVHITVHVRKQIESWHFDCAFRELCSDLREVRKHLRSKRSATSTLRLFSSNFPLPAITRETHAYHDTIVICHLLSIGLRKSRYREGVEGLFGACGVTCQIWCFFVFLFPFRNSKVKTKPRKWHVLFLRTCSLLHSNQWEDRRQSKKKTLTL